MRICFGLVLMRGNLELWHVYGVGIRGGWIWGKDIAK